MTIKVDDDSLQQETEPGDKPNKKKQAAGNTTIQWLKTTQGIIMAIVAVLVVVPSLVNALIDVYISLFNIPMSISERNNQRLFQLHFQKKPIHTGASVIKTKEGKETTIKFNVYENGDIYIEYGDYSQWFPFKPVEENKRLEWLLPVSYAAEIANTTTASPCALAKQTEKKPSDSTGKFSPSFSYYIQQDYKQDNTTMRRERIYEDGCKETLEINMSSGAILQRKIETITLTEEQKAALHQGEGIQAFPPQIIDIQEIKNRAEARKPDPAHSPTPDKRPEPEKK